MNSRPNNRIRPAIRNIVLAFVWIAASNLLASAEVLTLFGTRAAGLGKGFSVATFDTVTGALSAPRLIREAAGPAYFVFHPNGLHLFTTNSVDSFGDRPGGAISAYSVNPLNLRLTLQNFVPTDVYGPCYLSLDKTGNYALVANYNGGYIAIYAIQRDGSFGERTAYIPLEGKGIDPTRQTSPHAHCFVTDPTNRYALATDLGTDRIVIYRFDETNGSLLPHSAVNITPGSGPRHLTFHPNGRFAYLINELHNTITALKWDAATGTATELQTIGTLPPDFTGTNTAAEIEVHPNGMFLYCTNRGHNSIASFAVDTITGHLQTPEHTSSRGQSPRYFAFDPSHRWLIVTNHDSNNAMVFGVNAQTGKLTPCGNPVTVPFPFGVRFYQTVVKPTGF